MKLLGLLENLLLASAISSVCVSQFVYTGSFTRTTVAVEEETTTTTTTDTVESSYATQVKALIDAGTCSRAANNTICGDDATGHYESFEYNGDRVIIVSGAPDHAASVDAYIEGTTLTNWINRCERWQYSVVPLSPTKSTTTDWSNYENYPYFGMGVCGFAISGATFFDTRSDNSGSTALDNELDRLDTCLGHPAPTIYQYHYHGTPLCIPNDEWLANDPTQCLFVGYMLDGFPIYGRCQHTDGTELESCWTTEETEPDHLEDYTYGSTASGNACYLDEANGYDFTEGQTSDGYVGYGYVTQTGFSGVPIGLMGSVFGDICGFTPE